MTVASDALAQDNDLLGNLLPGHPRLIVLDERVEAVKERIKTDAALARYWRETQEQAEKLFKVKPVVYEIVGPRLLTQSRNCLERVTTFAIMYRMTGEQKWVDRAVKELDAAAHFPDWNPSHFLDTAELTHAFAIGYDWLYPALTEDQRVMIRTALVEKGLKVGMQAYNGAKFGWWTKAHHNWNQVCNGGLVLGALAVADEEPELARGILKNALASLPLAMKSFAPDGGWSEGPGYWDYTLRYTLPLILGLESALGDDFGLSDYEGFSETGGFMLQMVGPIGLPFNYADVGSGKVWGNWLMHELGRRFDHPAYQHRGGANPSHLGLFFYQPAEGDLNDLEPTARLFKGVEVVCMRTRWDDRRASFVGFKGGDNQANHSHLDLGCFVFDALGQRWALDLGSDDYNMPGYFGKQRWTYYRLATAGQNTLLLDNQNQNPKARAPIIAFDGGVKPLAVADLSAGYASQARRVWRGVALVNDAQSLVVQDEIEADKPVEYRWQMHTKAEIKINSPTSATLTLGGETLHAALDADIRAHFAVEDAKAPPPQAQNEGVRKLLVLSDQPVQSASVAVLLSPTADSRFGVAPLAEWVKRAGIKKD